MSFAALKQNRNKALEKIIQKSTETNREESITDDRFWVPSVDPKTELGSATIRFLPTADGDDAPWVKVMHHAFKGPTGKWFIEECPTTIGKECPVCKLNSELWESGQKDEVRKRKRQVKYISNVYIIKDPKNPENEGKVKLFKYGKQIFDKILAVINPEFEDEDPINPFDFWEGCDFRLKISKNEGGYRTYEKSSFDSPSVLGGFDDEQLEKIWNQQYPLREFLDPSRFKSTAELERRLQIVLDDRGVATTIEDAIAQKNSNRAASKNNQDENKKSSDIDQLIEDTNQASDDEDWEELLKDL